MKKRIVALVMSACFLVILSFGCSDKQQASSEGAGAGVNTSVTGTPNASLFDVWTITATLQSATTCPSDFTSAQEEYLIQLVTGNECRLDDELTNGDDLVNDGLLFGEEQTTCRAGGNAIVLQAEDSQTFSENCSLSGSLAARLELNGDALNGNYELMITSSETCPAAFDVFRNCKVLLSLSGQRGRHASEDQSYIPLIQTPEMSFEDVLPPGTGTDVPGTPGTPSGSGGSGGTTGTGSPPDEGASAPEPEFITFTDANLAAKVRTALSLAADAAIPRSACAGLTELNAGHAAHTPSSGRVANLSGIERCTGLKKLYLNYNNITNLSPLASLTALEELEVFNNNFGQEEKLTDISPLSGLTSLKVLKFFNNYVRNLSPLANLISLQTLSIGYNAYGVGFDSLSPIAGLTSLKRLQLCGNNISDITSLAGLTNLEYLDLLQNSISNLTPIENLVELDVLQLWTNDINGLNSLATLHENGGLGAGDVVTIKGNPIATTGSMGTANGVIIETLEEAGVTVRRDTDVFP